MAQESVLTFSNRSEKCSDSTIGDSLNGLPSIPANAKLTDVKLICNVSLSGGPTREICKLIARAGSTDIYTSAEYTGRTSFSVNTSILSSINNNNGSLTYKATGGTSLDLRGYHPNAVYTATWSLTNIKIVAYYEPHTHTTEVRNATVATCETDGYTGDTYCKTCGEKVSSGTTIPALGHTWVDATCTTPQTCSVCGVTVPGTELGHNYIEEIIEPTVSSHGCKRHTCTRCGDTYETDIKYLITVEASPPEGGTVSGGGIYNAGDSVTVSGLANTGWRIYDWIENGEAWGGEPASRYSFNANASKSFVIVFKRRSYVLTLNAENGTIEGATNGASYEYETSLTLTAVPDEGYKFVKWSDDVTDETRTIIITHQDYNNTYTAIFERRETYAFSIITDNCTAEVAINDVVVEGDIDGDYDYHTKFKITVKPDFGYEISGIHMIDVNGSVTVFRRDTLTLTLTQSVTIKCVCERVLAPFFTSREQQVKNVYFVPALSTVVYLVDGDLPALETTIQTVDDLHFEVINTDIDTKYGLYAYYPIEQLYANLERIW